MKMNFISGRKPKSTSRMRNNRIYLLLFSLLSITSRSGSLY